MKSFSEIGIYEINEIRKLEKVLKSLEMLCLEDIQSSKNVFNKNLPAFFDIDEDGKTFFTGFKEGKLVYYINYLSNSLNITKENQDVLINSLLASIQMLNDLGYDSISEVDKIKEIFSFTRYAMRVK